ncbi:conjugal transfer protein TraF [Escherichia coli]
MATELETAGQKWSLGFTPKFQRVDLFNYNTLIKNYDRAAHSKVTVTTTPKTVLTLISVPPPGPG